MHPARHLSHRQLQPGDRRLHYDDRRGTCNLGAFDYDKAGRLIRDRTAELHYDGYDQLREVLPIASPPPITNLRPEDLSVPGATQTLAGHSNSFGHLPVGGTMPSGVTRTLVHRGVGAVEDLNATLGISTSLYANSMNDAGALAGSWKNTTDGPFRAFRYDRTGFHDLGNPGDTTVAYDLNNANQVVGVITTGTTARGYRHSDATGFEDIGTLGGAQSWAWRIDDVGVVSASAQTPDSPSVGQARLGHAVLYQDVIGLQDLNDLIDPVAGTTLVVANEKQGDWVVGFALQGETQRAYRLKLSTGALDDIGWAGSSTASSVNSSGDAVGWGHLEASNTTQAAWILSERTGFAKLNDLIDPASGWDLRVPAGIDDFGDVVGWGYHNGIVSAFRLRIPAHSSGTGGPMVAEVHTYGFDGLRTSTTTAPGTGSASTQYWFTQDYTEHDGKREHYVRVGDRIVAKVSFSPPMGGGGEGMGALVDPRHPPIDLEELVTKILLAMLLAGGLAATGAGVLGKKRRPGWVSIAAGPVLLFFVASCEEMGTNRRSAATVWERIETVFFHHGIAAGPVLTTNADGALREERRYEPFGHPLDANLGGTHGPVDFRREAQNTLGKLTNPNTGWSYHGARWIQPQTARWTAPDPAVKSPDDDAAEVFWSLNPYSYADNGPSAAWDPDGRAPRRAPPGYHYFRNERLGEDWYVKDPPRPPSTARVKPDKGEVLGKKVESIKGFSLKGGNSPKIMSQLPGRGTGFLNHAAPYDYARPQTIRKIQAAAAEFFEATDEEYVLSIGHMSKKGGGTVDPDHKMHDEGLSVDVVIREAAGKHRKINMMSSDPKLVGVMNKAYRAFMNHNAKGIEVDDTYFNNPDVPGPTDLENHDDHMHFQFRLTDEED